MFVGGVLGKAKLHQLHLFKLVLADQAPCVTAIAPSLTSKTRGIGCVVLRQIASVQDLVRVVICDGDLCRRYQREFPGIFYMKKVLLELRQLIGSKQSRAIYQE